MKKLTFFFILVFAVGAFSSNSYGNDFGRKVRDFFIGYLGGKVVDYVWDNVTGRPDINRLNREVNIIKSKLPLTAPFLQRIASQVDSHTSASEFKGIVNAESYRLQRSIEENNIRISNLDARIDNLYSQLEDRIDKNSRDIDRLERIVGDGSEYIVSSSEGKNIIRRYLNGAYNIQTSKDADFLWQNSFTDRMKNKLPINSFKAWWIRTVSSFRYGNIYLIDKNMFHVGYVFNLKDGREVCSSDKILLKHQFGAWKIHDIHYGTHDPC